jgi:phosphatidylserine decarboxylase
MLVAIFPFLAVLDIVLIVLGYLSPSLLHLSILGIEIVLGTLAIAFFRDPERSLGQGLLAPVNGRVLGVDDEGERSRVSTFMGPFDVHVVRAPLGGTLKGMERRGDGFKKADTPSATHNVQVELKFESDAEPFTVVMLAGWFARQIVPYIGIGDRVERGSRIGLIRFGSRVDVLVPQGTYDFSVTPGDRVVSGASSLGVRSSADG